MSIQLENIIENAELQFGAPEIELVDLLKEVHDKCASLNCLCIDFNYQNYKPDTVTVQVSKELLDKVPGSATVKSGDTHDLYYKKFRSVTFVAAKRVA